MHTTTSDIAVPHCGHLTADARGANTGATVLFLHGGGQTRHAWGGAAEQMASKGWRTITVDLPGHGDSGWMGDGDYGREKMIDVTAALFRHLSVASTGPLIAVGASMGGLLSFASPAYTDQPLFDALVLVDVAPKVEESGIDRIINFMKDSMGGFDSLEAAADYIAAYVPHRKRTKNLEGLKKNLRQREDGRWMWHWDPKLFDGKPSDPRQRREVYELAASRIHCPLLLIRGKMSDVVSDVGVEDLRQLCPQTEFVDLQGAAHMVAGDVNDAFTDTVADFLNRL